eukprot:scaffold6425_cov27-Tisochrysis_lutea.AAC.1
MRRHTRLIVLLEWKHAATGSSAVMERESGSETARGAAIEALGMQHPDLPSPVIRVCVREV